jgi:hypothetical protein
LNLNILVTKKFDDGSQFTNATKEVKNIYPSLNEFEYEGDFKDDKASGKDTTFIRDSVKYYTLLESD